MQTTNKALSGLNVGIVTKKWDSWQSKPQDLPDNIKARPQTEGHGIIYDYLKASGADNVFVLNWGNTIVETCKNGIGLSVAGNHYDSKNPLPLNVVYDSMNNPFILEALREQNIPLVNEPSALAITDDKNSTSFELAKKHVGTIPNYAIGSQVALSDFLLQHPQPHVLKKPVGNGGNGVIAANPQELASVSSNIFNESTKVNNGGYQHFSTSALTAMGYFQQPLSIQPVINKNEDYRVYVLNRKALAFIIREKSPDAPDNEVCTNLAQGGLTHEVNMSAVEQNPLYKEIEHLAVDAVKAIHGLRFAAVDILVDQSSGRKIPEVIEINSAFGLKALGDHPDVVLSPLIQEMKKLSNYHPEINNKLPFN